VIEVVSASDWLHKWQSDGVQINSQELLYYRARPFLPPFVGKKGSQFLQGNKLSAQRGRGMEFDEVRHYQPGDDIRAIDWRVTARTGDTYTKLFREEKERPVLVCVDLSHSMQFGSKLLFKSVCAAHLAAAIAWGVVKAGDRVGGLVFTNHHAHEMKPHGRERGALRWLQLITKTAQEKSVQKSQQTFYRQLQRLQKLATPGADLIMISDFQQLDEPSLTLLRGLKRHNRIVAIRITDPLELSLPANVQETLTAIDDEYEITMHLDSAQFRSNYEAQSFELQNQQALKLQGIGIRLVDFTADVPPELQWRNLRSLKR